MKISRRGFRPLLTMLAVALVAAAAPASLEAQKNCTKGKPCGNTCIAKDKTCRVGTGSARQGSRAGAAGSVQVPEGMLYVASTRGRTYYSVTCAGWRSLAARNLRWFATRTEAEAAGLRPSKQRGCAGPAAPEGPAAAAAAGTARPVPPPGVAFAATCAVGRVIDGDTFVCGEERVRLLLIDSPELDQGPYGARAQAALIQLLPAGTRVRLELDVQERDRYGRILAHVYEPGGRFVNEAMLRQGYAVVSVYPPNVKYVERFRSVQVEARSARRGLWSGSAFECLPSDHRAGRCER